MPGTSRYGTLATRLVRWLALAVVLTLISCGSSQPETAAPDRVRVGPQGAVGQFVVDCGFDRFLADDPIVHPDAAGASHLHQFFGAVGVHASSTYDELVAGDTTCEQRLDTASYWAPVLLDSEFEPIEPVGATAYYRAAEGVDPRSWCRTQPVSWPSPVTTRPWSRSPCRWWHGVAIPVRFAPSRHQIALPGRPCA